MISCPTTLDRKGNSFTCSTPSRRDMICPSLEMSRVSNISNIVLKGESRVGEGRGPARSERKKEGGEEEKKSAWGRGRWRNYQEIVRNRVRESEC